MSETVTEVVETGEKRDARGRRMAPKLRRAAMLAAYEGSGLTMSAFARREGIRYYTLIDWLRQRRERLAREAMVKPVGFVEGDGPGVGYALEVVLPGGLIGRARGAEEAVACVRGLR